jgi:hypothetical protein
MAVESELTLLLAEERYKLIPLNALNMEYSRDVTRGTNPFATVFSKE